MVLYEINLTIDNNSFESFMEWLPGHVKRVLKAKGFIEASIFQEESEALQITVFYKVKSREDLEFYFVRDGQRFDLIFSGVKADAWIPLIDETVFDDALMHATPGAEPQRCEASLQHQQPHWNWSFAAN